MHPCPEFTDQGQRQWSPVARVPTNSDHLEIYQLTEAVYHMEMDFPFSQQDQDLIVKQVPHVLTTEGYLSRMRFGMCLVRLRLRPRNATDDETVNILLDAGLGPYLSTVSKCSGHPVPEPPPYALPSLLQQVDPTLTLADIDFVIYSHGHGDHVGWALELQQPLSTANKKQTIHCFHRREFEYAMYSGCPWNKSLRRRFEHLQGTEQLRLFGTSGGNSVTKDITERFILDSQKAPNVAVLLVEGHTPGHLCVEIQDPTTLRPIAVYIGDAMHFTLQVQYPDLAPLFDCCAWRVRSFLAVGGEEAVETTWTKTMRSSPNTWNETTSGRSRRKLLHHVASTQSLLLSPHFLPPGIGHVTEQRTTSNVEQEYDGASSVFSFQLINGR